MTSDSRQRARADQRRALLAERLSKRAAQQTYPLSYPQQRLWFLSQLEPDNAVYNVPLGYLITGPLDVPALERAMTGLVARHEVLRTVFRSVDGRPHQRILPARPVTISVRDLTGHPDPRAEAALLARHEARTPLDLAAGPMLRPVLLRLSPAEHRLCLTIHHIVCDGWSIEIICRELSASYTAELAGGPAQLPALPLQYADFAQWQVDHLRGEPLDELLEHWREHLAGVPALASLPVDHPRPPTQSYRGGHLDFVLPDDAATRAAELARQVGATPFAVLLAAFSVFLRSYTGTDEVVVGSPVAGRHRAELDGLIGFFANTLVQRIDLAGDPTFRELVGRARDEAMTSIAYQDLPFEKLVDELHPDRDLAHNPLFQVLFSHHEESAEGLQLAGCEVTPAPGDSGTAKFDLTLSLTQSAGRLSARLEYNADLLEAATAGRMAEQFRTVLSAAMDDPDLPITRLPVLPESERRQIVQEWNDTDTAHESHVLVPELFARQLARTPDAPAVVGAGQAPGQALSYRALDARAERIAARLRTAGVGPDLLVGVYLDRSPDLVATLLGILKAGGAYLPLDPGYPPERLSFMIADSGTPIVVSRGSLARWLTQLPVSVLRLDTDIEAEPHIGNDVDVDGQSRVVADPAPPPGDPGPTGHPDDLAYVTYTSGSTGRPKGVMVTHRNVATFFAGMDAILGADEPGTWLAVTSISFDISVLELLWTLARGYCVVVRGDEPSAGRESGNGARVPAAVQARPMDFSVFYFGGDYGTDAGNRYRLLMAGAQFADRNGFSAVWTPERHFHEFGGLFPNPSVTAAAIAAVTERVQIRAGSVVLPLHDTIRVAEEWSVVDNISGGRVGISVASGWQPNDFVLAPERYPDRKQLMLAGIAEVRRLWRGEPVRRRGGAGNEVDVRVFPPPVQPELPVWVTSARSPETFQLAGQVGAGLLTHLLGHTVEQLADKIALYRQAWRDSGHPGDGQVTLMLHTFVGPDGDAVKETVREPLVQYIKSSFDLLSGLGQTMGRDDFGQLPDDELDALARQAFERFFDTAALLGTPDKCADLIDGLKAIGVDEVACLIDFGVAEEAVIASLEHLAVARDLSEDRRRAAAADEPIAVQVARHGVTHLQCTPSLAGVLAEDEQARAALRGLRRLLVGGEALPAPLAADLGGLVLGHVHNMYGPTEATVWATTHPVEPDGDVVLIGHPLANVRAYVTDDHQRPVPINVPGELLLGGPGIVRGYLHRPSLTADRFVPDAFSGRPGARLYRTGDLVRWRPGGELEFLGRLDHQVKVHGHRIELGEIENLLSTHPGIRTAVTVVRGDGSRRGIVAYCVPVGDADRAGELTDRMVQAFVGRTLPEFMVPSAVIFLDTLPLTPNGKIDRARLPEPAAPGGRPEFRPPDNDRERVIAEVWAELLGRDEVGAEDNFFELGGNSLLAVQARARLLTRLDDRISLVDLFRYPTVRALAASVTGDRPGLPELAQIQEAAGRRVSALAGQARARRDRRIS